MLHDFLAAMDRTLYAWTTAMCRTQHLRALACTAMPARRGPPCPSMPLYMAHGGSVLISISFCSPNLSALCIPKSNCCAAQKQWDVCAQAACLW